jgi:unsaturated rhamnogalacturonyl hydrolase
MSPGRVALFCLALFGSEAEVNAETREQVLSRARSVADRYVALHPAQKEKWDWEDAVFLHGLSELRRVDAESAPRYRAYLHDFHQRWSDKGIPKIDRSDRCASALSALALIEQDGDWVGVDGALAVADYVRREPRNRYGALNHVGRSWLNLVYPKSFWLDSLMMYGVFAARWGSFADERALVDFAASQPRIFAEKLQDPSTGLFRHAWLTNLDHAVPREEAYWLRGNGWVLAAGAQILAELPASHPERAGIVRILDRLARGLARYQGADGQWDSILNDPGYSYPETSGAALVAYGIARGVREGWLAPDLLPVALRAYEGVTRRLRPTALGLQMPGISGPTNAFPKFMYKLVKQTTDKGYGVGAYLMASVAIFQLGDSTNP